MQAPEILSIFHHDTGCLIMVVSGPPHARKILGELNQRVLDSAYSLFHDHIPRSTRSQYLNVWTFGLTSNGWIRKACKCKLRSLFIIIDLSSRVQQKRKENTKKTRKKTYNNNLQLTSHKSLVAWTWTFELSRRGFGRFTICMDVDNLGKDYGGPFWTKFNLA